MRSPTRARRKRGRTATQCGPERGAEQGTKREMEPLTVKEGEPDRQPARRPRHGRSLLAASRRHLAGAPDQSAVDEYRSCADVHPGVGPARERKTDRHRRRPQPLGPSPEPARETGYLLGEGHALAGFLIADEPPHPRRHHDELARRRQITRKTQAGAVNSPRPAPAPRTGRPSRGRTGLDPDDPCRSPRPIPPTRPRAGKTAVRSTAAALRSRRRAADHTTVQPGGFRADFTGRRRSGAHDWPAAHEPGSTHQAT